MSKKPLVFLINSLCEGGAARVMVNLAKVFSEQKEDVVILALTKNDFYRVPDSVTVVYLSKMNDEMSGFRKMLYIPYHAFKLKKYIKKNEVTVVVSFLFRANFINIIAKMIKSKHQAKVANRSVVSRFLKEGLSGKLNMSLTRWLYPKADLIVHQSKRMKQDFHEQVKCSVDEVVIYNPFDIKSILLESQKKIDFKFKEENSYLVTVGRLIPLKRFEDLIEVLSELPSNVELIMLGDGAEKDRLQKLAQKYAVTNRIHFIGQVKNPFPYIYQSDVFVSTSAVEGFPNVLVESMVCNTFVVSSDCVSGPREILAPKSDEKFQLTLGKELTNHGILYAVGDKIALKESIQKYLNSEALENSSHSRSLDFSMENISNSFLKIFY